MIFDYNYTYKAIDIKGNIIKSGMKFIAVIGAYHVLTEDECLKYYGSTLNKVRLKTSRNPLYVFDKMVISLPSQFVEILRE